MVPERLEQLIKQLHRGGVVLLTALNVLEPFNMNGFKANSSATYHLLAEALRKGHHARSRFVGDPGFFDVPINDLINKKHACFLLMRSLIGTSKNPGSPTNLERA